MRNQDLETCMLKVNIKMIHFIHLFQTGMVERKGENDFNKYTRLL